MPPTGAGRCARRSGGSRTKIEDDDTAVLIVVVLIRGGAAKRREPFEGQLQAGLALFSTFTFPLLSLPDLLDDEGGQHRGSSVASVTGLSNCAPRQDRGHLPVQSDFSNVPRAVKLWLRFNLRRRAEAAPERGAPAIAGRFGLPGANERLGAAGRLVCSRP